MKIILDDSVKVGGNGVWLAKVSPHDVKQLGDALLTTDDRSVLLLRDPIYDQPRRRLEFERSNIVVLNLGTTSDTVIVKSSGQWLNSSDEEVVKSQPTASNFPTSSGDDKFLRIIRDEMPTAMKSAGESLLEDVRKRHPGSLKQGKGRRFTETPDNFWAILVQPRVENYYISVRGAPERHNTKSIEILRGRNPNYSAFYLRQASQVDEALEIILRAKNL